ALGTNIARTERDAAERALLTAAQEVARATAQVDQAQAQLDNHLLRAPMAGTVLALTVEPGQTIDTSTVLMTIANLDQLIVETNVDEAYAMQIKAGQSAILQLSGEANTHPGKVSFVSQQVDADTGGLAVELSFESPIHAPVGLTVSTNIVVDERQDAITAPRTAIDRDAVFVVTDGIASRRPVSVIDWPAARLIVTDGLEPGDVLVLDAAAVTDGQAVRVLVP
ncbi:MAG: efflux RND transporter periplasmic adaptor subunit, partial [Alphaproteobacteria bacterium]|nr:efflux RND transporter periplasmic adaptor subunit [Alphaproteobacteria bacterium]